VQGIEAVRFATPDSLDGYSSSANDAQPVVARAAQLLSSRTPVDSTAALEESFFLGLRLNRGVSLAEITDRIGPGAVREVEPVVGELIESGLLERAGERVSLTSRGRLLSNDVFARFLREKSALR
jgi:oxygen-independent coproporphyrinogen-3 oxidase